MPKRRRQNGSERDILTVGTWIPHIQPMRSLIRHAFIIDNKVVGGALTEVGGVWK